MFNIMAVIMANMAAGEVGLVEKAFGIYLKLVVNFLSNSVFKL